MNFRIRSGAIATLLVAVAGCLSAPAVHAQAPGDGPGGPVLVLVDPADKFGRYYAEILRAEGLNEFAVADVGSLSAQTLSTYRVVVLAETGLSDAQAALLDSWVGDRRQPHRDAPRSEAGRTARPGLGRRRPRQRLSAGGAGPRHHRRDDAVPRQGRPLDRRGGHHRRDALLGRRHRHDESRGDAARGQAPARPPRSRTTSPAPSSTRARATRRGLGRSVMERKGPSARTTSSSVAASRAGWTWTRWRSRRLTSSSACWRIS